MLTKENYTFGDGKVAPQSFCWNTSLMWGNALGRDAAENELLESFKPLFSTATKFRSVRFSPTLQFVSLRSLRGGEKEREGSERQVQWMSSSVPIESESEVKHLKKKKVKWYETVRYYQNSCGSLCMSVCAQLLSLFVSFSFFLFNKKSKNTWLLH